MVTDTIKNTFPTPNEIADDALPYLREGELKIIMAASRRILGYDNNRQEGKARISLSLFQTLTGLTRSTVTKTLKFLRRCGVLVAHGKPTHKGQLWSIGRNPDIDALITRHDTKSKPEKTSKKTVEDQPEVVQSLDQQNDEVVQSLDQQNDEKGSNDYTSSSLTIRPEVVQSLDQKWSNDYTHINKDINQVENKKTLSPDGDESVEEISNKQTPELKEFVATAYFGFDDIDAITEANWKLISKVLSQILNVHDANGTICTVRHLRAFLPWYEKDCNGASLPLRNGMELHYGRFYAEKKKQHTQQKSNNDAVDDDGESRFSEYRNRPKPWEVA